MTMEPFESDRNFQEDVGLFEAATHAVPVTLPTLEVRNVLLVTDGSNQDDTARALARLMSQRLQAQLHEQSGASDAAGIIDLVRHHQADLLIVPAPFGRDYDVLADESLGSVIDMLLLESPCPLLCVRGEMSGEAIEEALQRVLVPMAVGEHHGERPLAWAFRIVGRGGRIDLLTIADDHVLQEARQLVSEADDKAFDPEHVRRAVLRKIGGIVSVAQRQGQLQDCRVHVETRVGRFVPQVMQQAEDQPRLLIWEMERDHDAPSFHRGVDLLLASPNPVLFTT